MINLSKITDLSVSGKKVLVRADLDVGETLEEGDDSKLLTSKETLDYLVENGAKIILISHRGRPGGKIDENLSLAQVAERLSVLTNKKINFVSDISGDEAGNKVSSLNAGEIICLENLRFDPREEANDETLSRRFAELSDLYVNEAFSSSAKEHASIVGVPKILPHAAGFHFLREVENLSRVLENPRRPVVVIISGIKEDKLSYVEPFSKFADKILIAGRLPDLIDREVVKLNADIPQEKLLIADLVADKEDITLRSVERFEKEIESAGTVVVGGPMGKYEDEGHRQGTKRVFDAIAKSSAFKVAGGGDTEQVITLLSLNGNFDWVSVGGGAMLDYLANGTLPGIQVLTK